MRKLAQENHTILALCQALDVNRAAYYAWLKASEQPGVRALENQRLSQEISTLFLQQRRNYGAPRIHQSLRKKGVACGRHRVARLMRQQGLCARKKRRFVPRTTHSSHPLPIAANLLLEAAPTTGINQVWQSDITYLATGQGWCYLAGVLDRHSRFCVGWSLKDSMPAELVCEALNQALGRRQPSAGLIHHSDRGSQYASQSFRDLLEEHDLKASMSRRGNCYDNALVESFGATLKRECFQERIPATRREAEEEIFKWIETDYNRKRLPSSLNYQSPLDFENNQP